MVQFVSAVIFIVFSLLCLSLCVSEPIVLMSVCFVSCCVICQAYPSTGSFTHVAELGKVPYERGSESLYQFTRVTGPTTASAPSSYPSVVAWSLSSILFSCFSRSLLHEISISTQLPNMYLSHVLESRLNDSSRPVLAAYKNFSVKNSTKRYLGIWHAQVLSLSIEDSYPGNGEIATSLKLSIGEPGTDGYSSELQVPWAPGYVACLFFRAFML